jgi:hypothetical protein
VDIKNAKNGGKTNKIQSIQDLGLIYKKTKLTGLKRRNLDLIVRKLIWWKHRLVKIQKHRG